MVLGPQRSSGKTEYRRFSIRSSGRYVLSGGGGGACGITVIEVKRQGRHRFLVLKSGL